MYRETWAEIDLNAIRYNIQQMRKRLPTTSAITAVVKANGYGHGSIEVAQTALRSGAEALAVALLEEAIVLRDAGITAPILVMSWVPPKGAKLAAENDITLTFFQTDWLAEVNKLTLSKPLKLHMKCDTGMGRSGIRTIDELEKILHALNKTNNIHLTGVYTHFATADEEDLNYFQKQQDRFSDFLMTLQEIWKEPVNVHVGNSAASMRFPEQMHQFIRFGVSMYGLYPSPTVKIERPIELKQAFSLHSRLIHVKEVPAHEGISYGRTYETKGNEWIGTIPIGYGDGWNRKLQGMEVLVEGRRYPIVGRICMDQMMIKLDRSYPIGTKVTLIGKQMDDMIEVDELAKHLDTITYEIPCMLNQRIPRLYIESE